MAGSAFAQQTAPKPSSKAAQSALAPSYSKSGLIALDVGPDQALKFGVDPTTLSISKDGIVRYVIVASSDTGATNAMYEGIRCSTGEYTTYARATTAGHWETVQDPEWSSLYANMPSRHALVLAEQGACNGTVPASSVQTIIRQLKRPLNFERR
ncbi:MAG: CNP1-like family protein [Rhodoferax sp.]